MITVWKYDLELTDHQVIDLPRHSKPLYAGFDGRGMLVLWVLVSTLEEKMVKNGIRIAGTGHEISHPIPIYLNTLMQNDGTLVWHIFWEGALYDLPVARENDFPAAREDALNPGVW